MSRVLIVEDEPAILRGLADNLRFENYDVVTAPDGETGLRLLKQEPLDLVILDLMLPHMSGYKVCRRARQEGITTPILMLTARGEEGDKVHGLDLGADDYVSKPFALPELLARIRALLRRGAAKPAPPLLDELFFEDVRVDFRHYEAYRSDTAVDLTRKEFAVLRLLASRAPEVLTREELLNQVWGQEAFPTTRTVDNHVLSLRSKLGARPLLTVHGVGYKWSPTNS
jgi:DNA-binding response OmpR family regulator